MRRIGTVLWIALVTVLCVGANYYYWLTLSDVPVLAGELTEEWQECILGLVTSGMMAVTGIYSGIGSVKKREGRFFSGAVGGILLGIVAIPLFCVAARLVFSLAGVWVPWCAQYAAVMNPPASELASPKASPLEETFAAGYFCSMWAFALLGRFAGKGDGGDDSSDDEVYIDQTPLGEIIDSYYSDM